MRRMIPALLLIAALVSAPSMGFAASPWVDENASYQDQSIAKLEYGIKNSLGGWTEIFTTPFRYHDEGKNWLEGTLVGIGNAVVYTVGGALHFLTFYCPSIDVPIPNDGVSLG